MINLSNFNRDVWTPARAAAFPADSPLRDVRRHDLRHAAITAWLNAGVPLKTCQAWSGHKTVSVLLDIYLGVTVDDAHVSLQRIEDYLNDAFADDPDASDCAPVSSQNHHNTRGKAETRRSTVANGETHAMTAFSQASARIRTKRLSRGWSRDGESNPGPAHYE